MTHIIVTSAICVLAALISGFFYFMRREAGSAVLETVRLTESEGGLRVLQLSDIHVKIKSVPLSSIIPIVRDAAPHVVTLTGDYIESAGDAGRFLSWMEALIGAAAGATFYLCFGNHDNKAFSRSPPLKRELTKNLKRLGVYIMENRTLPFSHNGKLYAFTGFRDYYSQPYYNPRIALKRAPKDVRYHVGISHNPDLALDLGGSRPDLLLLGHFHGGQIWIPFHLEYICLRRERLCKIGIRRGLHNFGGRLIYISRGLGCVVVPLRLGSRPEITLFILP